MSLKIALVGCGKIADGHIEEIRKMPEKASVVAVCDLEILMAEQVAERYGVPAHYHDLDQMLSKERPDVVHITTPPQSHLPIAKAAIDAGCHVYVEKPLALNAGDARVLVEYAEGADRKLTVGYSYLFDPPAVELREMVDEGKLGEIVHVESFFGYNLAGPFGAAIMGDAGHWVHRLPGKLIQNNIDHILYRLAEFIPDDDPRIVAVGSRRRDKRYEDVRDELIDELRIVVQGDRVTGYGTFSSHAKPVGNFLRVYGTRNTAHIDFTMRTVAMEPTSTLPGAFGRLVPAFTHALQYFRQGRRNLRRFRKADFHYFSGLNTLISRYYDSILADGPLPIPHRDILRIAAMMDEIIRQAGVEAVRA